MKFRADYILTQQDSLSFKLLKNQFVSTDHQGRFSMVCDFSNQAIDHHFHDLLIPGLTNAHSHGFQILMRGKADNPMNFQDWVSSYLYPTVDSIDEKILRKGLQKLFRQMLKNGITTLGEFHYFHHHNPHDFKFDLLFLEEARNSGIRLSLLQSAYDLGKKEAQKKFHSSTTEFLKSLDAIEEWLQNENLSDQWALSVAPHSLHGCSDELLRNSVTWANQRQLKWHIHLAEQQEDIPFSQNKYGKSPLFALEHILKNQLNENTCLVHACWLDKNEIDLFNERQLNLTYNPFTNMYLGDGTTSTLEMNFNNSSVALGTDSNNAFNMFTEAKLFECLQRLKHLEMGMIDSSILLSSITSFGGNLLNLDVGKIQEKNYADFLEIDLTDICELKNIDSIKLTNHLIFSGLDSSHIKNRYISGKKVSI